MRKQILFLFFLFFRVPLHSDSWEDIGDKAKDFANGIGDSVKGFGEGIASMGGYVSGDYLYSWQVFNGIQDSIKAEIADKKNIMGARFNSGIGATVILKPGEISGNTFLKRHLYLAVEVAAQDGSTFFSEGHYTLGNKNDTTVFAYHTFQDSTGAYQAEKVGVVATTDKFSGMIYNGYNKATPVTFTFGGKQVTISLEPDTYNTLKSTTTNPLRPSILTFAQNTVVIGAQGFGTSSTSS